MADANLDRRIREVLWLVTGVVAGYLLSGAVYTNEHITVPTGYSARSPMTECVYRVNRLTGSTSLLAGQPACPPVPTSSR
jgi:hypothetical protein